MSGQHLPEIIRETDPLAVHKAAEVLANGGLVVFPTDTVYGLAASIDRPDAVARLYTAKGRPLDRPIPVLVSSRRQAERLAASVDRNSQLLMERFWPGGLTILLPAADWLPFEVVRDTGQVGVRMPHHRLALAIIEASGGALATTSANRSGEPEAKTTEQVRDVLGSAVDLILDGGTGGGIPSTVVRFSGNDLIVLRRGAIEPERLLRAIEGARLAD
jgi:L-threonylcarbamoyladenylate synthase